MTWQASQIREPCSAADGKITLKYAYLRRFEISLEENGQLWAYRKP
jgi:hypothetical protein